MALITPTDIHNVFDTALSDTILNAMIAGADAMVQNGPALSTNPVLTSAELFQVELYIALHFLDLRDPIALQAKIGDAMQRSFPESITTAWGQGLRQTVFGQMAISLDRSGSLAKLGLARASYKAARREDSFKYTRNLTKTGAD